jgi:hypothetical protein
VHPKLLECIDARELGRILLKKKKEKKIHLCIDPCLLDKKLKKI